MKIISLGGIGGCDLAASLRDLNQPAGPWDWLITTQSFVIRSFDTFDNFFKFDEKFVHDQTLLLVEDKKAIILHDFTDFAAQKIEVIEKYKKRFERLHDILNSNEPVLFVRIWDNLDESISSYYDTIFAREQEQLAVWNNFITDKIKSYPNIRLLVITSNRTVANTAAELAPDVIVEFVEDIKKSENITKIIHLHL
jgi:hypothetical protein